MFERYTERARRVIFFARYEASQFGSVMIETEHLLLGLLREDKNLLSRLGNGLSSEALRDEIVGRLQVREKVSTSIDLPLSLECKRILAYAGEEAERLNHRYIGTEHLALGVMREEKCVAAQVLSQHGLKIERVREHLARDAPDQETLIANAVADVRPGFSFFFHNPALPKSGVVTDSNTAKRIAEAVWEAAYGRETITAQLPSQAILQHNVWIVTGSAASLQDALFAFILQVDGRILSVGRGPGL